jgi:hypothetical protein
MTYTIHLVTGEKGGVGKSTASLLLIAYYVYRQIPFLVVECDRSNGDVGDACQGKHTVIHGRFTDNLDEINAADVVLESVLEHQVSAIVNLPAQSSDGLSAWLRYGSLDAATENQIKFIVWLTTNGEKDSIGLVYQALNSFGAQIQHVLVRNIYFTDKIRYDFSSPDKNDDLAALLSSKSVPLVNMPRFVPTDLDVVRTHNLTLSEAIKTPLLGVVSRSRLRRALHEFFAQLNTLEVFNDGVSKRSGSRKKN